MDGILKHGIPEGFIEGGSGVKIKIFAYLILPMKDKGMNGSLPFAITKLCGSDV